MEVIGAVQPSNFPQPSVREVAERIDQLKELGRPAVFGSGVFASDGLEAIASEANAQFIDGDPSSVAGAAVSGAGDVDADGHTDILIGAHKDDAGGSDAGAAYLLLGPATGTIALSASDVRLLGENDEDYTGHAVSGGGETGRAQG